MPDTADLALRNLERLVQKDPLLRDLLHPTLPGPKSTKRYSPDVDVVETETGYTVLIDLPGVAKDAVEVQLEGTKLHVSGDRRRALPEGRVKVSERSAGPFRRTFLLPFQADGANISARLRDGVLQVVIPRKGAAGVRTVEIE